MLDEKASAPCGFIEPFSMGEPVEQQQTERGATESAFSVFREQLKAAESYRMRTVVAIVILIALASTPGLALKVTKLFGIEASGSNPMGSAFFLAWNPLIAFGLLILCYNSLQRVFSVTKILAAQTNRGLEWQFMLALLFGAEGEGNKGYSCLVRWLTLAIIEAPYIGYLVFIWATFFFLSYTDQLHTKLFVRLAFDPCEWRHWGANQLYTRFDDGNSAPFSPLAVFFYLAFGMITLGMFLHEVKQWRSLWREEEQRQQFDAIKVALKEKPS